VPVRRGPASALPTVPERMTLVREPEGSVADPKRSRQSSYGAAPILKLMDIVDSRRSLSIRRMLRCIVAACFMSELTSAIHTKVKSSLIIRLNCGNTLKSPGEPAPFGCRSHQAFPQVIRSTRSRS